MQQINTQGMPAPEEAGPAGVTASCGTESGVELSTKLHQNLLA